MELKQMKYFVEIVNCGGFSAAAEKNFVTQSALSKIIKRLEDELDTKLLYSQGKITVPTDTGQIFYKYAQKILNDCNALVAQIGALKGNPAGTLKITTPGSWNRMPRIYDLITSFIKAYPHIHVDVHKMDSNSFKDSLFIGETDLAITCGIHEPDPQFEVLQLIADYYYFVLPKTFPQARKNSIDWADVAGCPLVLLTDTYRLHNVVLDRIHQLGIEPDIRMTSDQVDLLLDVANQNGWCTILGEALLPIDLERHRTLACVPMTEPNKFCLMRRKEPYATQAERVFMEFLHVHWR